jgi:hypothetical protein
MRRSRSIFIVILTLGALSASGDLHAQQAKPSGDAAKPAAPASPAAQEANGAAYSGMYAFLKEGEFVQVTVEDTGRVTGFVSRFGDEDGGQGAFLDQFFKSGKMEGNKLSFTTQTVRGLAFEFKGTVERGEGKNPGDEAYFVLKGTLTENVSDANKKVTAHSQEVVFKKFPDEKK